MFVYFNLFKSGGILLIPFTYLSPTTIFASEFLKEKKSFYNVCKAFIYFQINLFVHSGVSKSFQNFSNEIYFTPEKINHIIYAIKLVKIFYIEMLMLKIKNCERGTRREEIKE